MPRGGRQRTTHDESGSSRPIHSEDSDHSPSTTHRRTEAAASAATVSSPPVTDLISLLQYMDNQRRADEERRRQEDEERRRQEDERRRQEDERQKQEDIQRRQEENACFEAMLARLTVTAPQPPEPQTPAPQASTARVTPKATAQPPPLLNPDVTFQNFREWRLRWTDYAKMVDVFSLPQPKQLIQLRMCLSLETQRVLEHTLQVHPDSTQSVSEVLDVLQTHKEST